jgi:DNA-binding SARP family transcriptional activator
MAYLAISLLGPFQVSLDGKPVTAFESDKVRALLAYLAVEADQPHRRESLAGLLWPERPERSARHNLSQALSNLRSLIVNTDDASPVLFVSQHTIQFNAECDHTLDVSAFTELVAGCERHPDNPHEVCDACMERLQRAAAVCRGDFMAGFSLADSPVFEEWAVVQRERLHRMAIEALRLLCACHEERGEFEEALRHAWRWVALEPWQERAHREVMRLLALSGQRSAALRQYQTCRRILADELEVEPAESTGDLFRRIRDGEFGEVDEPRRREGVKRSEGRSPTLRLPIRIIGLALLSVLAMGLAAGFFIWKSGSAFSYACTDRVEIPQSECRALVALYNSTEGAHWKVNDGWLSDDTPCDWYGVVCSRGSVSELNLSDNHLSGGIPEDVDRLTNLSVLDLSYNHLAGSIPSELGDLHNLTVLSLSGNSQLCGPIPPELGGLVRLEGLYLSTYKRGSQLEGPIPPELGDLSGLIWLEISDSLVDGPIPPELGNLTHLMSLDLGYNRLSGPIPPELGKLSDLRYLNVCGNAHLSGPIPPELGNLSRLEGLYLSSDLDSGKYQV